MAEMKCIKCGKEGAKYIERRQRETTSSKDPIPRTNFKAACKSCGWSGEII